MIQKQRILVCLVCKKKHFVTEGQDGIIDTLENCKRCKTKIVDVEVRKHKRVPSSNAIMFMREALEEAKYFIKWHLDTEEKAISRNPDIVREKPVDLVRKGDRVLFGSSYRIKSHYSNLEKWNAEHNTKFKTLTDFVIWSRTSGIPKYKIGQGLGVSDMYILKLYRKIDSYQLQPPKRAA